MICDKESTLKSFKSLEPAVHKRPRDAVNTSLWLSHIIRLKRRQTQITQISLAAELELGMSFISTLESGNAFANMQRTIEIMCYLDIEIDESVSFIQAQQRLAACYLKHASTATIIPAWSKHQRYPTVAKVHQELM